MKAATALSKEAWGIVDNMLSNDVGHATLTLSKNGKVRFQASITHLRHAYHHIIVIALGEHDRKAAEKRKRALQYRREQKAKKRAARLAAAAAARSKKPCT